MTMCHRMDFTLNSTMYCRLEYTQPLTMCHRMDCTLKMSLAHSWKVCTKEFEFECVSVCGCVLKEF